MKTNDNYLKLLHKIKKELNLISINQAATRAINNHFLFEKEFIRFCTKYAKSDYFKNQ